MTLVDSQSDEIQEISQIPEDTLNVETDADSYIGENSTNSNPTVVMGQVTKRLNGGVQYKATFYDNDGNPLSNKEVIFEVDDSVDYSIKTDSNGVALANLAIKNGNHKIAVLNLDTFEIASDNIKVFDVLRGNKDITMYYDGGNTYKVRVYGNDGKPVKAGQKVTFAIGKTKYVKKTDKNGYATLKITSKPGLYQIGAIYKDFAVINDLYVKQVLKPLTSFNGKSLKSTFKYKVKFLGKNVKNKKIQIKFNKKKYSAKTNKKGIATFTLKTPKKMGKYNVVASYKNTKMTTIFVKYYA